MSALGRSASASRRRLGRQASVTSSWAHQAWSSPSRRTDSAGSAPVASRFGRAHCACVTTAAPSPHPRASRYLRPHAGGGRHRGHLHRRGGRRRAHRQGAVHARRPRPRGARRRGGAGDGPATRRCSPTAPRSPPTRCSRATAPRSRSSRRPGLRDVIEIARQDRPVALRHRGRASRAPRAAGLAPRGGRSPGRRRHGAGARRASARCRTIPPTPTAVAVCLLHADLEPAHEQAVAAALRAAGTTSRAPTRCRPRCGSTSARSRRS